MNFLDSTCLAISYYNILLVFSLSKFKFFYIYIINYIIYLLILENSLIISFNSSNLAYKIFNLSKAL